MPQQKEKYVDDNSDDDDEIFQQFSKRKFSARTHTHTQIQKLQSVCIYNIFINNNCFANDDNDNDDVQLPSARFMLLVYNNYAIIEYFKVK